VGQVEGLAGGETHHSTDDDKKFPEPSLYQRNNDSSSRLIAQLISS